MKSTRFHVCAFVEVPLVVHVVSPETQERDASEVQL